MINRNVFVTPDKVFELFSGFHNDLESDNTE